MNKETTKKAPYLLTNVLSPISVAIIAEKDANNPLKKSLLPDALSNLNLSLIFTPPENAGGESPPSEGVIAATPLPPLAVAPSLPPPNSLDNAAVYSDSLIE